MDPLPHRPFELKSLIMLLRGRQRLIIVVLPVVLVTIVFLLLRTRGEVEINLTKAQRVGTNDVAVTVVLTNGTRRKKHIVDDNTGNPAIVLHTGERGMWLTTMVNQLKVELSPGASITNTVFITNAPSQFCLKVMVRDLRTERFEVLWAPVEAIEPYVSEKWQSRLKRLRHEEGPASEWIIVTNLPSANQ